MCETRDAMFWKIFTFGIFVAATRDLGVYAQKIPKTSFSCDGRTSGYYADVSTGCQIYHMCDGLGRQFSYRCPSKTLFQQRMLICDHWYMVNCSKAEEDYSANLLIGQQRHFVEDLQFHRTPRPDLADPASLNFNEYKADTADENSPKNVVGAEESVVASTDEPTYFLPSHWSTEFSAPSTTPTPAKREESDTAVKGFVKQVFYKTSYNTGNGFLNAISLPASKIDSINRNDNALHVNLKPKDTTARSGKILPNGINFPSSFKATTPVYPEHLDIDLSKFTNFETPQLEQNIDKKVQNVNFPSNFQATTPVYPNHVEFDPSKLSEFDLPPGVKNEELVNFKSNFKATTPVYPSHVDVDPAKISEFDLPIENGETGPVVINFESKFKATTPVYPKVVEGIDLSKFSGNEEVPPPEKRVPANVVINFESNFKATTPVYPKVVEGVDLSKFSGYEEVPPGPSNQRAAVVNFASNFKATTPVYPKQVDVDLSKFQEPVELPKVSASNNTVNFGSEFKATTPVYPQSVEATSPIPEDIGLLPPLPYADSQARPSQNSNGIINFASSFKATTPVYPKSVEATSPDPSGVGLVPPDAKGQVAGVPVPSIDIEPPSFESTFKRRIDEEDPSVVGNTFNSQQLNEFMITIRPEQLRDLKQLWHIPDYEFPLDSVSRPSYESDLSSFQTLSKKSRTPS